MANPSMGSSPGTAQEAQHLEKYVLSIPNGIALARAKAPEKLSALGSSISFIWQGGTK